MTRRPTLILALLAGLFSLSVRAREPSFDRLVASLAEADRDARHQAVAELLRAGIAARPALLEGSRSDHPEVRARSAELLLKLPWFHPDDPPAIRRALENYGTHDANGRKNVIRSLQALTVNEPQMLATLGRLFLEEPSESVQWVLAGRLREFRDADFRARLREADPAAAGTAVVALSGVAWIEKDLEQARLRLERATEMISRGNLSNPMEAAFVFETLRRLCVATRRYDEAALSQRKWIDVGSGLGTGGPPVGVPELFALHAQYGPLSGLAKDLARHAPFLLCPEIVYALAHGAGRKVGTSPGLALRWAAWSMSCGLTRSRQRVAEFLEKQGWHDARRFELLAMLTHDARTAEIKEYYDINAHLDLAEVAIRRGRDLSAAENFRKALALLDRSSRMGLPDRQRVELEMHWRYVRAARRKNDLSGLEANLARLLSAKPTNDSMALDLVPVLKELGRKDDAKKVFEDAYAEAKKRLEANPSSPGEWNHMAWLCARCDERLDEALKLASDAVKKDPENAAYLDTAAEVNFRLGNRARAVELESRAIELRPGDAFMREQLRRFKGEIVVSGPEPE